MDCGGRAQSIIKTFRWPHLFPGTYWTMRCWLGLLCVWAFLQHAYAQLVPVPQFGVRLARGFRISQFSDSNLANDIYAMTIDPRGDVVVTSQGYIRTLLDANDD